MKNFLLGLMIAPFFTLQGTDREVSSLFGGWKDTLVRKPAFFEGELRPSGSKPCFKGAYYRKAVSSKDVWLGIAGTVVLPKITFDAGRKNDRQPGQFLDNPSVYMGGNMNDQETDVGLTWAVTKDEQGRISTDRKAFRPFFRRTAYTATGQKDIWQNAPASREYYWYPGEEVRMSLRVVKDGKLRILVEGAGKRYEADFNADGYRMDAMGEFKRVNAIDQVRNEGKPAQPTLTRVENAVWKETVFFRMHKGKVIAVPMHKGRFTDMRCPDVKYFKISANAQQEQVGAETISIYGDAR